MINSENQPDFKDNKLIPAIIVDNRTSQVLMLAYMNQESYRLSVERKQTWFWSRSRQELWHKGETSGNTQVIKKIDLDCDSDTLLIRVDPAGPACHTGHTSCFFKPILE